MGAGTVLAAVKSWNGGDLRIRWICVLAVASSALAHVAWALSFCRIVPETQWIDSLLASLTAPAEQQPEVPRLSPDAVLDLAQALKVRGMNGWGTRPWTALAVVLELGEQNQRKPPGGEALGVMHIELLLGVPDQNQGSVQRSC
eukprot:1156104-Pelagomonas_calceolata.AAC.8